MNNHNPTKRTQQVMVLSAQACPSCGNHTMVSLSNIEPVLQAIAAPRMGPAQIRVLDMHILCFHCLYRAHWVPGKTEFQTVWESQMTMNPQGGLIRSQED